MSEYDLTLEEDTNVNRNHWILYLIFYRTPNIFWQSFFSPLGKNKRALSFQIYKKSHLPSIYPNLKYKPLWCQNARVNETIQFNLQQQMVRIRLDHPFPQQNGEFLAN